MSIYKTIYNPFSKSLQFVPSGTILTWKESVADFASLPTEGNTENDARIVSDTQNLYVWDGTQWVDQGDIFDILWDSIEGKPSSTPTNIDDAVSKRHTQNTDTKLDEGGANEVSASQTKEGYTHSQISSGNPHSVSKSDVGLGNVDNKSEATIITDVKADSDVADAISKKHTQNTDTETNSDDFAIGDGTDTDKTLTANNGDENKPRMKYNSASNKWQYTDNGTDFYDFGVSPGGAGSGDMLKSVYDTDEDGIVDKAESIDDGIGNSASASNIKDAVDKKHAQNTDTKLDENGDNEVSASEIVKNIYNVVLLAFKLAIQGSLTIFNMIDGIMDEYEDESGIDTINSINQQYVSDDDYYKPSGGGMDSPLLHFKCNDNAGNTDVTDDGTGANDGTSSTNTSNLTDVGKINSCFHFDAGSSEYINIDDFLADVNTETKGSFSFWVNPDITDAQKLISLGDQDNNNYLYIGIGGNNMEVNVTVGGVAQLSATPPASSIPTSTWTHVAIVQNGTELKIYINGDDKTLTWYTETDKGAWINDAGGAVLDTGRLACRNYGSLGNSQFFDGKVDDMRYYSDKALIQTEIDALYNSGDGTEDENPIISTNNMTLISDTFSADDIPVSARFVIFEEDVDSITINTDLKAYLTRDGGSTWLEVTLSDECDYDTSKRILIATGDFTQSGIGEGTDVAYKLVTANNKDLKIHGAGLHWTNI